MYGADSSPANGRERSRLAPRRPSRSRPFYGTSAYANSRIGSNEPLRIDALSSKPSHPSIIDA